MTTPAELGVFAVEDDSVQFTWRFLGEGQYQIKLADQVVVFSAANEPGAITIGGLQPNRDYTAEFVAPRLPEARQVHFTTLRPPSGRLLVRVGMIGDTHLGSSRFGITKRIREHDAPECSANRCAAAALDEMEQWGITHLFVKGDLINKGTVSEWATAERLFTDRSFPVDVTLGNHEVDHGALVADGLDRIGASPIAPVRFLDLRGVRIITVETAEPDQRHGVLGTRAEAALRVAREATQPVVIVMHHHLHRHAPQLMLPQGVLRREAQPFLQELDRVAPYAVVISGHSHRHRRYDVGTVTVIETGSTKDFPGTWTGLAIYDGGIRQVVRRIERPDCMAWTEKTRAAALGLWEWWSPGRLEQRCFVKRWRSPIRHRR